MINKDWLYKNRFKLLFFSVIFLLVNYLSYYFRAFSGDLLSKVTNLTNNLPVIFSAFPISLNGTDLMFSFIGVGVAVLLVLNNESNSKSFRTGVEHGSAEWGIPNKDLKGMYNQKDNTENIIFTENTKMAIDNSKLSSHEFHRNKNTIVIGGTGSGKTRFFVKPNIMQMNSDYVITDPKGDILNDLGYLLRAKKNYDIKVLNLIDFDKSMRYNPLAYVKNEQDILKLVETLIKNTSGKDAKEDFWVNAEKLLYQALLGMILEFMDPEDRHLGTLADLISLFEVKENDENYVSVVDDRFQKIEEYDPNAFCVKQYRAFKISAGETAKSILISCSTRLAPLNIPAVRELLSSDELQVDELGNQPLRDKNGNIQYDDKNNVIYRPTAFFIIIPDTDRTYNFIVSMMYTQMFNMLVTIADTKFNGKLPRHVRFILDEFANIGEIPEFQTLIATIRSREISVSPILQTLSQLKSIYKESSDTIVGNCDTLVFLGGKEESTLKMISNQLGKETIDDYNTSRTRSQSDSYGQNYSKLGRELMTPDELQKMDRSKAIVMITNLPPFIDNKFNLEDHPYNDYHGIPPKIDERTGEVLNKGKCKYWFDTDKYVKNYRIIYNRKMAKIYELERQQLEVSKINEEPKNVEEELTEEQMNEMNKEALENDVIEISIISPDKNTTIFNKQENNIDKNNQRIVKALKKPDKREERFKRAFTGK